jgi:Zn-dependent peptidase ImmA (M78 family)/DNA-binding XRE family transcriptional regulator
VDTVDAATLGKRIADARGRAGLTQEALAAAAALDRSTLAKIETGARRVSALELTRIANAVDERIEWFVFEPPPSIVSRRNMQEPGAVSPAIDRLAERIARHVEFVQEYDKEFVLPVPQSLSRPENRSAVEAVAQEARALLGLNADDAVPELARRVADVGLLAFSVDLGPDTADAGCITLRQGAIALVNGNRHIGRRRLALAHELGHYLFADEYATDWRVSEHANGDAWESRLDHFARAVLLPSAGLRAYWTSLRDSDAGLRERAVRTASLFRVDMSTLALRLRDLRLTDHTEFARVRDVRTHKADIVEFNLVVPHELEPPELARPYVAAVLRLYRQERISAARATDLLLDTWDESDLPELPPVPESAIWEFV